jgi:polysaccharide export outer membrane protein
MARLAMQATGCSCLALTACASTPDPQIGTSASEPVIGLGQAGFTQTRSDTYALRASDRIAVRVLREEDLSLEDVLIGIDGIVSIPMIGAVPAAGMTTQQLEQDIALRLSKAGIKRPMATVNIVAYASQFITVEGTVEKPGVYAVHPGARLSSAVALAGGLKATARHDQVAVFRESEGGIMVARFDYRKISQGTMLDPVLHPDDRVVIGTDGLAVFWQDMIKALPAFGVFAVIGTR